MSIYGTSNLSALMFISTLWDLIPHIVGAALNQRRSLERSSHTLSCSNTNTWAARNASNGAIEGAAFCFVMEYRRCIKDLTP